MYHRFHEIKSLVQTKNVSEEKWIMKIEDTLRDITVKSLALHDVNNILHNACVAIGEEKKNSEIKKAMSVLSDFITILHSNYAKLLM